MSDRWSIRNVARQTRGAMNALPNAYTKHPCPIARALLARAQAALIRAEKDLRAAISLRERRRTT